MAGEQDIIGLGLNIDSFNDQKMATLKKFIDIFNDLSKFDGKIFNPVMGDGLSTFNTSIAQTSKLIDQMNAKLAELSNIQKNSSTSASQNAKSNTELGLAMKEYEKASSEAAKTNAKLSVSSSQLLKDNAALKVQLAEIKKQLMDEAKANNDSYKARMADIAAKKQATKQQRADAEQAKKAAREKAELEKKESRDAIAAIKAQNKAIKEQEKQVESLANKHLQLKILLKKQRDEYVNNFVNFGAEDPKTVRSLKVAQETAGIMDGINVDLRTAEGNATRFGAALTRGFSVLRNIAYILPGLGIAGIFNIAFDVIGKVVSQLDMFTSKLEKQRDLTLLINKSIKEQLDIYVEIVEKMKSLNQLDENSISNQKRALDNMKSRGLSQGTILSGDLSVASNDVIKSTDNVNKVFGGEANIKKDLDERLNKVKIIQFELDRIGRQEIQNARIRAGLADKEKMKGEPLGLQLMTQGQLDKMKESLNAELAIKNKTYEVALGIANKYYTSIAEKEKVLAEIQKYNSDQQRKLFVETSKDNISVEQNKNQIILSDIRTTHQERLNILKKEKDNTLLQNYYERVNITGTDKNPNAQYSPETTEYKVAINKQATDNKKANDKYNAEVLKANIDFFQSQLKAKIEIQKNEVEVSAINNERIEQNENASLKDRLEAYTRYILEKGKLEDLEYELASNAGKSFEGDTKSSLTKEEIDKLDSDRDKAKLIQRADTENKIYSIVYSSLQKRLKAVIDIGEIEGAFNNQKLIEELEKNNEKYKKKEQSFFRYIENRKKILEVDERETLEKEIEDDERQRKRLSNLRDETLYNLKVFERQLKLAKEAPDSEDKKYNVDTAQGKVTGATKALLDVDKQIAENDRRQQSNKLRKAKIPYDDDNKLRNQWIDAAIAIEKELLDATTEIANRIYENKVNLIERQKDLMNQQYESEIAAIEKSSLKAKEKAALDIQLNQEKIENERYASEQQRRLKIQEAEFNKKLAITDATINLAATIIKDGITTPKAIANAIIGGIRLAAIIATPIPSFAEGTGPEGLERGMFVRHSEEGPEFIKKPGESAYLSLRETIQYLPKGTQIIPTTSESPVFDNRTPDESWEQTRFLAKYIAKSNKKEIKNVFKPTIVVDMGFENRKRQILGN